MKVETKRYSEKTGKWETTFEESASQSENHTGRNFLIFCIVMTALGIIYVQYQKNHSSSYYMPDEIDNPCIAYKC